jgi:hypothetical protein
MAAAKKDHLTLSGFGLGNSFRNVSLVSAPPPHAGAEAAEEESSTSTSEGRRRAYLMARRESAKGEQSTVECHHFDIR